MASKRDTGTATDTEQRLEDIRSMMDAGHKSIRIEKHTFFYWGIAGGLLTLLIEMLYRDSKLINTTIYVLLCAITLGTVGYLDYRKTHELRRSQDKSVSFIQTRITQVWWLLLGTAILFVVGLMVYGGVAVYSIWFVLIGVAIIIHASFSTQPLRQYGFALIATAIVSPALLPYSGLMWTAVSIYAVGIPLLGFMLYQNSGFWQADKPYAVVIWLILAITPGYVVYKIEDNKNKLHIPELTVSLAAYQSNPSNQSTLQIIKIPAGTTVPLKLSAQGDVFSDSVFTQLPLVLKESVEIVLDNGEVNGTYRVGNGAWSRLKSWEVLRLKDMLVKVTPDEGLTINAKLGILDKQ